MAAPQRSLRFADDNGSSTDNGVEESFHGFAEAVPSTSRGSGGKMDAYLATLTESEKKNLTPRKISTMCMLLSEVEEDELSMHEDDPDFDASDSDLDNASDSGDDAGDRDGGRVRGGKLGSARVPKGKRASASRGTLPSRKRGRGHRARSAGGRGRGRREDSDSDLSSLSDAGGSESEHVLGTEGADGWDYDPIPPP